MAETVIESDTSTIRTAQRASLRSTVAIAISILALVISGISFGGWMQASAERQLIENRLVCLELPGPNDCQQDAR